MRRLLALLVLAAAATLAQAGRPCENRPPDVEAVRQGMNLAVATARALDASGAQVLLLARAGQDLGKYGLRWSHLGFVYRERAAARPAPGVWRVLHKLNHCGTAEAALYRQGLGEFFLDQPHRYEAAFVALKPELQARLLPLLRDNQRAARVNEPRYNMVAYPWATTYQQSNQWALETLALAAEGVDDALPAGVASRRQAQAWLVRQDWRPTTLRLGTLTRLGARATAANVAFDDHPDERRFANLIDTVTVDSIFDWLPRAGWGGATVVVR